jgi:hypothetical protein
MAVREGLSVPEWIRNLIVLELKVADAFVSFSIRDFRM